MSIPTITQHPAANRAVDPVSGLRFYELSHEWGHGVPTLPGYADPHIFRAVNHARHGVMSQRIKTVMHTGTHLNAPHHMAQRAQGVGELALERLFAPGVIISCPKGEWELVSADDLQAATPEVKAGEVLLIVTGWHRYYSDSQRYFAHSPGLDLSAANWLIERGVAAVGVDTAQIDHPCATSLADHRNGPTTPYLPRTYESQTGRKAIDDFPEWNPAHRALAEAGIPTIENVGGEIAELAGTRATIHALPWKWPEGDACPIRLMGIVDTTGDFRVDSGSES